MNILLLSKLKTVHLQGFLSKTVYLKCFGNQLKTVYLQGPCSSRPCISRPCCASKECFWPKNFLNFMHRFKSAILEKMKNCQNGTFELLNSTEVDQLSQDAVILLAGVVCMLYGLGLSVSSLPHFIREGLFTALAKRQ